MELKSLWWAKQVSGMRSKKGGRGASARNKKSGLTQNCDGLELQTTPFELI